MLQRDIQVLDELFLLSRTVKPEVKQFRIVCALCDNKGNIISYGFPRRKSHPLQKETSGTNNEYKVCLHAEVDCILRAKLNRIPDRKNLVMYLVRSKLQRISESPEEYEWISGLSKPCDTCERLILKLGIGKVYFSQDNIGYGVLEP